MYVLHEYLKLVEKNPDFVNPLWKIVHIFLLLSASLFSAMNALSLIMLSNSFNVFCVLYPRSAQISHKNSDKDDYGVIQIKIEDANGAVYQAYLKMTWLEKPACRFPEYIALLSSIFGIIWVSLFLMCSAGGRSITGLQRPWRVVPFALIFSLIMAITSFFATAIQVSGIGQLFRVLRNVFQNTNVEIEGVNVWAKMTKTSAWLQTLCWLLNCLVFMLRIAFAVDFQLVRVKVAIDGYDPDYDSLEEEIEEPEEFLEGRIKKRNLSYTLSVSKSFNESSKKSKKFTAMIKSHFQGPRKKIVESLATISAKVLGVVDIRSKHSKNNSNTTSRVSSKEFLVEDLYRAKSTQSASSVSTEKEEKIVDPISTSDEKDTLQNNPESIAKEFHPNRAENKSKDYLLGEFYNILNTRSNKPNSDITTSTNTTNEWYDVESTPGSVRSEVVGKKSESSKINKDAGQSGNAQVGTSQSASQLTPHSNQKELHHSKSVESISIDSSKSNIKGKGKDHVRIGSRTSIIVIKRGDKGSSIRLPKVKEGTFKSGILKVKDSDPKTEKTKDPNDKESTPGKSDEDTIDNEDEVNSKNDTKTKLDKNKDKSKDKEKQD